MTINEHSGDISYGIVTLSKKICRIDHPSSLRFPGNIERNRCLLVETGEIESSNNQQDYRGSNSEERGVEYKVQALKI